ncbi:MAG: hypothetical protein U0Z53_24080 [Blastocatellia bacterium]
MSDLIEGGLSTAFLRIAAHSEAGRIVAENNCAGDYSLRVPEGAFSLNNIHPGFQTSPRTLIIGNLRAIAKTLLPALW